MKNARWLKKTGRHIARYCKFRSLTMNADNIGQSCCGLHLINFSRGQSDRLRARSAFAGVSTGVTNPAEGLILHI